MKNSVVDGEWVRCWKCGAKLGKIVARFRSGEPNVAFEHKCKAKHNGKTCNSINVILL